MLDIVSYFTEYVFKYSLIINKFKFNFLGQSFFLIDKFGVLSLILG